MLTTWRFRVKDSGSAGRRLTAMARSVNFCWNFFKETQITALRRRSATIVKTRDGSTKAFPNFLSAFELSNLAAGAAKDMGLHSQTVQAVAEEYARRRKQFRKLLRWRGRSSLGWIPFKASAVKISHADVREWTGPYNGKPRSRGRGHISYVKNTYEFWASRILPADAVIKTGSFCQDAQGHWYVNLTFESSSLHHESQDREVGVDPGVKTLATLSDGQKIVGPKLRERYLAKIRRIERTRLSARRCQAKTRNYGPLPKRKRMAKLHAKVANARADYLHKASTRLVEEHRRIYIGNVPCKLMNRSRTMAAVSLDQGLGMFKMQVTYKAVRAGGQATEINERDSTRTCSECLSAHPRIQLRVREWQCSVCATVHDRDVNAARNILRLGREALTHPGDRKVAGA